MHYRQRSLGIVAACSLGASWTTTSVVQEQRLKVVSSANFETLSLPFLVAQSQCWLNAEAVQVSGDANAMRGLLSNGADVAIVGAFNIFSAVAENAQTGLAGIIIRYANLFATARMGADHRHRLTRHRIGGIGPDSRGAPRDGARLNKSANEP
jgi:hypothetical protein